MGMSDRAVRVTDTLPERLMWALASLCAWHLIGGDGCACAVMKAGETGVGSTGVCRVLLVPCWGFGAL
jgi:hypothetical protein